MTSWDRMSPGDRLYAALLRAYPRRFRARFEAEMRDSVRADGDQARRRGIAAAAVFWVRTSIEAVVFGLMERGGGPADPRWRPSRWAVDWRDAYRSLRATPVVTAVGVLSLALGIGANTALFSILNSLTLKTLPVANPEQLVVVDDGSWTNPIWEQIRDRHLFDGAFAWDAARFDLAERGETDFVSGAYASGDMFAVLGVHAILGRTFTAADDARGGGPDGPVAVISEGLWQRRFGGAPDVIGRRVTVAGLSLAVIGVTPRGFYGPDVGRAADIFVPVAVAGLMPGQGRMLDGRSTWWLEIMARLRPGQTIAQATAALDAAQPAIRRAAMPQDWKPSDQAQFLSQRLQLIPAARGESDLRSQYAQPLQIILAVVGAVLLIACANIANILLARATARRRELSLRLALGASRMRLARQLLVESLMLSAAGAVLGLVFAQWGSALLVRQLAGGRESVVLDLSPDWRVLLFTAAVAIATALLFGLAPALGVARLSPHDALKEQSRTIAGDRRLGLRNGLVVGQVALSLALVLGGALFLRTLAALVHAPIGFDPERLMTVEISARQMKPDAAMAGFSRLRDEVQDLPGVASVAVSALTPAGNMRWNTVIDTPPGMPATSDRERLSWVNVVSPGFFRTYGVRLLAGRDVSEVDTAGSPRVMVVNQAFARKFLAGREPIGAELSLSPEGPTSQVFRVIGLVSDAIYVSPRSGIQPTLYLPVPQVEATTGMSLTVRAARGAPGSLGRTIGQVIARTLPEASYTVRLLADQLGATVRQERLVAVLGGFFGGLALLLAALGLYGVTSYSVSRRRGEIGIRMALGASRSAVVRLVIGRAVGLIAAGVVLGTALSFWAGRFVSKLLFNVAPRDPATFAVAALVLLSAGLAAGWLPARRAASIDPARVLREG